MIQIVETCDQRICQGDIIEHVEHIEYVRRDGDFIEVSKIIFPLVVVLTQDCDLSQEFKLRQTENHDKQLVSVLVAPLYNAAHVKDGTHLKHLKRTMQVHGRQRFELIERNQTPRYHYIEFPETVAIVNSVIDFKHYFSVSLDELERSRPERFKCRIAELYREDISSRFAHFLARIGLPD